MRARITISLLLIIAVAITIAGRPSTESQSSRTASGDEQRLTPEEEQEARTLVEHFNERLQATSDIGPLVDEMFIKDFSERLRQAHAGGVFWVFLNKSVIASASSDELLRYYIASMNSFQLYFSLYEVLERSRKQSEDKEEELKPKDVLSPEIISVLLSDPTLAALVKEAEEEDEDDRAKEDDSNQSAENGDSAQAASTTAEAAATTATKKDENEIIKSVAQLNSISATLEKANELMRKRLASQLSILPTLLNNEDAENQPGSQQDALRFNLTTLDEGEFGYPKGTQVIHVDALPYCLHLIRIDGQLKILSATIYVD
jgi:hypothetical protein